MSFFQNTLVQHIMTYIDIEKAIGDNVVCLIKW